MKKLLISALLLLPAAAYAQELSRAELEAMPAKGPEEAAPAPRPDARKIMSEVSTALNLSSKQEERIAAAVGKKAAEFDKLLREYEKNLAEEKKWRYKMNESRHGLLKISREIPDIVREELDDEQRESFDAMLEGKKKPAGPAVAEEEDGAEAAPRPVRKKKLVKRKKAPAPGAAAAKPALKKKAPVKKAAPEPEPEAEEEPAAAAPAGQEAPAEDEDAGSYP